MAGRRWELLHAQPFDVVLAGFIDAEMDGYRCL